ncbi:Rv3235 family protein [Jatrophihabitans endophyticus]|uniref:Rv3235 family protein n=1 Tax=Jatrophihabitans endophyticus TaxID=1206085 RepID=UPI0019DB51CB|nr:Rv3235 family protein [Jatrophihabitans endophyticus]MBE7187827.1 hypothetical protein [Jatrophihabitans endophyticus]
MTAAAATTDAPPLAPPVARRRPVLVRPAPRREPPFDDELTEPSRVGVLDRHLPFAVAGRPPVRVPAVPGAAGPSGLADPAVFGRRLLLGLIECAGGRRPLHQLASMLSMSITRGLSQDFEGPGTATTHWLRRGSVRSVLVCRPADGVAELSATLGCGPRVRAVALRLEERHGRWCCTRLQLG